MFYLVRLLALAVSLVVSNTTGPAPLQTRVSITVSGPYEGPACVLIIEDGQLAAGPFCAEEELSVKEGESQTVKFPLTGNRPGSYEFMAVVNGEAHSELVKVTVQ